VVTGGPFREIQSSVFRGVRERKRTHERDQNELEHDENCFVRLVSLQAQIRHALPHWFRGARPEDESMVGSLISRLAGAFAWRESCHYLPIAGSSPG
jgi:hypothetical protein